jgi:hypothetical protein
MWYVRFNTKLKNMKILLKMNPKHHLPNDNKIILEELLLDTIHVHSELDGLLLAKKGISNIEPKNSCVQLVRVL